MKSSTFLNPPLTIPCIRRGIQSVIYKVSRPAVPDLITELKREGWRWWAIDCGSRRELGTEPGGPSDSTELGLYARSYLFSKSPI
jgi:hypothetical protein